MQTNPSIRVKHLFIADIFGIKSDSDIQCILKKSPPPFKPHRFFFGDVYDISIH